jgi:hypothetical protein
MQEDEVVLTCNGDENSVLIWTGPGMMKGYTDFVDYVTLSFESEGL